MVDDHEIEAGSKVGEGRIGELLQGAFVPGDRDVGMEFREALGRGHHGKVATRVVPCDAGEFDHDLDDGSSITGAATGMIRLLRDVAGRCSEEWNTRNGASMTGEMFFEDF